MATNFTAHLGDPIAFLSTLLASSQLLLPAGPAPLRLTFGCRVRVWTGALGTFLGRTRDGWCVVALDGERTVDGRPRTDEWQRWQVEVVS